jgi:hypothetical protein
MARAARAHRRGGAVGRAGRDRRHHAKRWVKVNLRRGAVGIVFDVEETRADRASFHALAPVGKSVLLAKTGIANVTLSLH